MDKRYLTPLKESDFLNLSHIECDSPRQRHGRPQKWTLLCLYAGSKEKNSSMIASIASIRLGDGTRRQNTSTGTVAADTVFVLAELRHIPIQSGRVKEELRKTPEHNVSFTTLHSYIAHRFSEQKMPAKKKNAKTLAKCSPRKTPVETRQTKRDQRELYPLWPRQRTAELWQIPAHLGFPVGPRNFKHVWN